MLSVLDVRKRFTSRVLGELPADLALGQEDLMGVLRYWVPRTIDGVGGYSGKRQPAYARPALFNIPATPRFSRARSGAGNIPFHFARNLAQGRTATGFAQYAWGKARGVEADLGLPPEGIDAAAKQAYIAGHGRVDGGPADGWSNLREASHWHAVEAFEREGRANPAGHPPGLSIFYERAPVLFDRLVREPDCPAGLVRLITKEQARVANGRPLSDRRARDGIRWVDERAFDTYAWIRRQPEWRADARERPARVSPGRAVQTHIAGEGEYPAILDGVARRRIRAGLIDFIQRQRNPTSEQGSDWFVPLTICDHAPDGLNDPLNDHFHWMTGTRRARYTEAGTLAFEATKVHAMTRKDWLRLMREEVARLTNVELAAIGADVRYHPGTLGEMGIDAVPQAKLNAGATVLERAGVTTAVGLANATEGWRRAFADADRVHAAALQQIDAALPAGDPAHDGPRASRITAAGLRHEAAEITLITAMATNRAERTLRFAPAYAASATSAAAAAGWRARGEEAARHLAHLERELVPERAAITERLARAERLEREADEQLRLAEERRVTAEREAQRAEARRAALQREDARAHEEAVAARRQAVHRAVDLIRAAPLLVTVEDGRLHVAVADDPDGLVAGVDLSGVQRRLAGIRAAQQRELAQVQAFVRRHGAAALFDDSCTSHSPWFRQAVAQWREAPVMQRYRATREAELRRDRGHARGGHHAGRGDGGGIAELAEVPSLADVLDLGDRADTAAAAGDGRPALDAATAVPVTTQAPHRQPAPVRASAPSQVFVPTPAPPVSAGPVWTDMEQQHRRLVAWRDERARRAVAADIEAALAERVGRGGFTPYATRLLLKVADGFDPAAVSMTPGINGLSLDQRDAAEIGVLGRDARFRAALAAAARRDAGLLQRLGAVVPATGPDVLGRVGLRHGRLAFAPAAATSADVLRTPLEWAQQTLALVAERGLPLTRQDGLVGLHDPDVLQLSGYNYLGLAHPSIQHGLEVQRRIDAQVERGLLADARAGRGTLALHIKHDQVADAVRTSVKLSGGTPQAQAFVAQRQFDANLYFRCREAMAAPREPVTALRHDVPVVRAWLKACDDGAPQPVRDGLARAVRKQGDLRVVGMAEADAKALTRLLTPAPTLTRPRPGRRDPRQRLSEQPGRDGPW